jgi:hypothetical protein
MSRVNGTLQRESRQQISESVLNELQEKGCPSIANFSEGKEATFVELRDTSNFQRLGGRDWVSCVAKGLK